MARGQLVLIAAVLIAVALVPIAGAYLQLGYDEDVRHSMDTVEPAVDANRTLAAAAHRAADGVPAAHPWRTRSAAASRFRTRFAAGIDAVEAGLLRHGIGRRVTYNATAAQAWADDHCPGGRGRQFGGCLVDGAVVLQERANDTHVVAVGVDVQVVEPDRHLSVTWVIRPV